AGGGGLLWLWGGGARRAPRWGAPPPLLCAWQSLGRTSASRRSRAGAPMISSKSLSHRRPQPGSSICTLLIGRTIAGAVGSPLAAARPGLAGHAHRAAAYAR